MIKELLKRNNLLRRVIKRIKIYYEYLGDAKDFSNYYLEEAEKSGNHSYRIMLLVHSLEKGMCMNGVRPFGQKKALELIKILNNSIDCCGFEYMLGVSALRAWADFFETHAWKDDDVYFTVKEYLTNKKVIYDAGIMKYDNLRDVVDDNFPAVIFSRHSVRDYEDKELSEQDLEFALKCFIQTPTACNRQMCRLYHIKNVELKQLLNNFIWGINGFNTSSMSYFIITYDLAAFDSFGERNQGYFNAGLVAMNFVNGLHYKGIGSCFMQWANKRKEDILVRNALKLSSSEKIAVVIGAGYYKKETNIPRSCRRSLKDIYKVIV